MNWHTVTLADKLIASFINLDICSVEKAWLCFVFHLRFMEMYARRLNTNRKQILMKYCTEFHAQNWERNTHNILFCFTFIKYIITCNVPILNIMHNKSSTCPFTKDSFRIPRLQTAFLYFEMYTTGCVEYLKPGYWIILKSNYSNSTVNTLYIHWYIRLARFHCVCCVPITDFPFSNVCTGLRKLFRRKNILYDPNL